MKRTLFTVIGILLISAAASANQPVGIPQNRKVISERAQKAAITRFLNVYEGRKLSFKQRNGQLGNFTTVGGTTRNWSTNGPLNALIFPPTGANAGWIETSKNHPRGTPRVTVFPTIMTTSP